MDISEETRSLVLEQKLKVIVRTADIAQQRDPIEVYEAWKATKMETLESTDNKSNSAMMK